MNKLFIITGQTATGKTAYALKLAEKYNGELVNFDSRQIYKYLDIITGKDLPQNSKAKFFLQKMSGNFSLGFYPINLTPSTPLTKIWLYDIVKPKQYFSSFDYADCSITVIKSIIEEGKTPILVGGNFLYIKHLLYGIDQNIAPNWKLRKELKNKSVQKLQSILSDINALLFNRLNNSEKNNPQRLIRKIEITKSDSGKTKSGKERRKTLLSELGIKMSDIEMTGFKYRKKTDLIDIIGKRVEKRIKEGAVEEVKHLLKKNYTEDDPGLKTIGYQQIVHYLKGMITKNEAVKQWITKEVQYAKRQLTFMRKDKNIVWKDI